MSRGVVVAAVAAVLLALAGLAVAAPGDLDRTFGVDGRSTFDLGGSDVANDVLVEPDGRIFLAGAGGSSQRFFVGRRAGDGSPDPGFLGSVFFGDPDPGVARAVARQPNGRLLAAGEDGDNAAVVRFLPSGEPDASFAPSTTSDDLAGGPGELELSYGGSPITGDDTAGDVLALPDGSIVLAGGSYTVDSQGLAVVTKLSPAGAIAGFGNAFIDFVGTGDTALAAARQADGRLVVAGVVVPAGSGLDIAVARIDGDNGQLDASFSPGGADGDGRLLLNVGLREAAEDVLVQPDGKIVLVGWRDNSNAFPAGPKDIVVVRLNPNGSPDPAFDGDGVVVIDLGANEDAQAGVLQADGKIVVAGIATTGGTLGFGLVRLQPGGAPDTTFGPSGTRAVAFPSGFGVAFGLAQQPDGKLVAVGAAAGGGGGDVALARLEGGSVPSGAGPGGPGGAPPRCGGKAATIVGTPGREVLKGTRRADVIAALAGNDTVSGLAGNDVVCGGPGRDLLKGGPGKDRLLGQAGNDRLLGGPGVNLLKGQAGRDILAGGPGPRDRCLGGLGRDRAACERGGG